MSIAEKLTTVAENQHKVYDAGKKAKNEEFWRSFTENGARKTYYYGFARTDFSGETIPEGLCRPQKHDSSFVAMDRMFYGYKGTTLPKGIDVTLVPEGESVGSMIFYVSNYLTEIYDMGIPAVPSMTSWFNYCNKLHTIEKIRVNENTTFTTTFGGTSSLKNVTFEGVIGRDINFQHSPLSVASLKNIIKHLKKYIGTSSEFAYTVTFKSSAFTELEAAGFTDDDWIWFEETFELTKETFEGLIKWADLVNALKWNLVLA